MDNFYITNDLKLRKMHGYKHFYNFGHPIDALYSTNLGGTEYLLTATNGKLYYFLQSDLDAAWPAINDEPTPGAIELTRDWQEVSHILMPSMRSEIITYAKYYSQDEVEKTTNYQYKVVYYNKSQQGITYSSCSFTAEGETRTYTSYTFGPGKTEVLGWGDIIEHPSDGSSVTHNITTSFNSSITGPLSATATVELPSIGFVPYYGVEPTLIGNIGNGDVSFFTFDKKVYILSGKYQSWDGTTLQEVEGYTPLVFINTPPTGGGVVYDEINMLSPKKHQTFNGDGTSTTFHLAQNYAVSGSNLDSIDRVEVDGDVIDPEDYSVDLVNGTVTFETAPQQAMDNVDIYWTLDDGDRDIIEGMRFGTVFGGDIDSRVFLYGNPVCQNRAYFSGISHENDIARPSVEYFPATAQIDIGPSNFALTDLTRQYDRLLATTNRPEAYYLTIATESLPVLLSDGSSTTRLVPSVSTFPLNEVHGNVAPGQGQLINNYPVTLDRNALIMWKATNVRDEKNMEDISQKIRLDLKSMDLSSFKTLDHESENQMWFGSEDNIYIYNYFNKTYSRLKIADTFTALTSLGNNVYMGLEDGRVTRWGEEYKNYDGEIIKAHWEMNFEDFETAYLRKTMNRVWVLMQPQASCSADIGFISNRSESSTKKHIQYNILLFENVDFGNFSFKISRNPQPFRLKMKAKKFTNLKITIDNEEETDCTILQLVLKVESFGESK